MGSQQNRLYSVLISPPQNLTIRVRVCFPGRSKRTSWAVSNTFEGAFKQKDYPIVFKPER